jgi:hypothetical protein
MIVKPDVLRSLLAFTFYAPLLPFQTTACILLPLQRNTNIQDTSKLRTVDPRLSTTATTTTPQLPPLESSAGYVALPSVQICHPSLELCLQPCQVVPQLTEPQLSTHLHAHSVTECSVRVKSDDHNEHI